VRARIVSGTSPGEATPVDSMHRGQCRVSRPFIGENRACSYFSDSMAANSPRYDSSSVRSPRLITLSGQGPKPPGHLRRAHNRFIIRGFRVLGAPRTAREQCQVRVIAALNSAFSRVKFCVKPRYFCVT
jgi:hypothetical protein